MANHKSALKKYRRDEKRRMVNRSNRSKMRNRIKTFRKLIEKGEVQAATELFPKVIAVIDRTASKGTIHSKTSARYKSRMYQMLNKAGATA